MPAPANEDRNSQSVQVARSAGIVSIAIFSSRISGLLREMVMAQLFGAGFAYDAYLLGFRIPNLTRDLFAEGALSSAFVPTFTAYLDKQNRAEAIRLLHLVATLIVAVVGSVAVLGMIFAPQLVATLAPGFNQIPGKFALAVHLARIMFPFLLLIALAAQIMGVLNACNRFGVPATASTLFNLSSVGLGLLIGFQLGPRIGILPIEGMAYGVVLGGIAQVLWQVPSLRKLGFNYRLAFDWNHPGLRQIFRLMIPAIIGNAAVQVNVMVNTNFASRISDPWRGPDGPVSWLAYAFRFMQLPLGLFGVSFAAAILPSVSRSVAAGNLEECRQTVSRSLAKVLLLTIPSSVGLILLGRPIIGAVYQGGRFGAYDTEQTALALACYAVGLAGYATTKILNPAFYALADTQTPMWISLFSVAANAVIAEILLSQFHMGIAGLALSTSFVALGGCLLLFMVLKHRLGGLEVSYLLSRLGSICLACLVMAVPVFFASSFLSNYLEHSKKADLITLAALVPFGILCFGIGSYLFQIEEFSSLLGSFVRSARKRLPAHARIHIK